MPIDYSQYLNANQRGLDTLNQTRLATLNQPNKVQSFMEGLRGGQDRVAQQRALTDKQKLEQALAAQKQAQAAREQGEYDYGVSQRPLKERSTQADIRYKDALSNRVDNPIDKPDPASYQFSSEGDLLWTRDRDNNIKPVLDPNTGKQMKQARPPSSGVWGQGNTSFFLLPSQPGEPMKMVNRKNPGDVRSVGNELTPVERPEVQLPVPVKSALSGNAKAMDEIARAKAAVEANPAAFGAQNYLMNEFSRQRVDPKGVAARSVLSKVSAVMIHDLTGSAQTVGEVERLKPFLPSIYDTPTAIKTKLEGLQNEYQAIKKQANLAYPREQGYRDNALLGEGGGAAPNSVKLTNKATGAKEWWHKDSSGNWIKE